MDNIAGQNSGSKLAVNITVLILVLLWLLPTIGLFVSSFRDRDQISNSGWWQAPLAVDLNFRTRVAADNPREENGVFVLEGNVFADPALASNFPEGTGTVAAYGTRAVAPGEFPAGEASELRSGGTVVVERDGSYRIESVEDDHTVNIGWSPLYERLADLDDFDAGAVCNIESGESYVIPRAAVWRRGQGS